MGRGGGGKGRFSTHLWEEGGEGIVSHLYQSLRGERVWSTDIEQVVQLPPC